MSFELELDDVYRVVVWNRHESQNGLNVSHVRVAQIVEAGATDEDLAAAISQGLEAQHKSWMSLVSEFRGVFVQRVFPTPTPAFLYDEGAGAGESDSDAMSTQTAGVIKLTTNQIGRSRRGRKYMPFPTEEFNDDVGKPTAGALVILNSVGSFYTSPLGVVGAVAGDALCFFGLWNGTPLVFTDFLNYQVRSNWGTQRRRSQINRPDAELN